MKLNYKISEYLKRLGYDTEEELSEFLSDKPRKAYDPFLLLDMDPGVDLILSAIDEGETICVYGDYDADGITSAALLTDVLSKLTDDVFYYIPSRFDEGYGLNTEALLKIHEMGAGLVVTVDCGSVSADEVRPNAVIMSYPVVTLGQYTNEGTKKVITGGDEDLIEKLSVEKRVDKNADAGI